MINEVQYAHLQVVLTSLLGAADNIHTAMCRTAFNNPVQTYLSDALQSSLIGAEEARQALMNLGKEKEPNEDMRPVPRPQER